MEPVKKSLRFQLVLARCRCEVEAAGLGLTGYKVTIHIGQGVKMQCHVPWDSADIRNGDLLTLYTEVPMKEGYNADANPPSIE